MNLLDVLLSPSALAGGAGHLCPARGRYDLRHPARPVRHARGRKTISWVMGFVQSVIFVVAISSVLGSLDNP